MASEYLNNKMLEECIVNFQTLQRKKIKFEYILEDLKTSDSRIQKRGSNKNAQIEGMSASYKILKSQFEICENDLALAFYKLSENLVRFAKFNLIDVDEGIQEGVVICFEKINRFDPNYVGKNGKKAKAFNYLTTCIYNHLRQLYRTAKNYNEFKKRLQQSFNDELEKVLLKDYQKRSKVNRF